MERGASILAGTNENAQAGPSSQAAIHPKAAPHHPPQLTQYHSTQPPKSARRPRTYAALPPRPTLSTLTDQAAGPSTSDRGRRDSEMSGIEESAPLIDLVSPAINTNPPVFPTNDLQPPANRSRRPSSTSTPVQPIGPNPNNAAKKTHHRHSTTSIPDARDDRLVGGHSVTAPGTWSPIPRP